MFSTVTRAISLYYLSIAISSTVVLAVPSNSSTVEPLEVAVSGFVQTCSVWGGIFGTIGTTNVGTLTATCGDGVGGSKTTSLDLNRCYVNLGGVVSCQANGGFLGSCQPVGPFPVTGNSALEMICGDGRGGFTRPGIDLNACVGNLGGTLAC